MHIYLNSVTCVLFFLFQEHRRYEADLERTFKKFTTKPVTQVALVTEYNLLLMLAGMCMYVHYTHMQAVRYTGCTHVHIQVHAHTHTACRLKLMHIVTFSI